MEEQIRQTALQWAEAVKTRISENVLELYHEEGLLWGTLSIVTRQGYSAVKEYFDMFLHRDGLACRFLDGTVRIYQDVALYSGRYEFTWKVGKDNILVPARFTFVYKKEGDRWLIIEHHSSLYPEIPFKIKKFIVRSN